MIRIAALLLAVSLACSGGPPGILELGIRKTAGVATPADLARLERRVLAVGGVTLVSVSASGETLLVHHSADTDTAQIETALSETGFRRVRTAD